MCLEKYLEVEAVLDVMTAFPQKGRFVFRSNLFFAGAFAVLATIRPKRAAMFARILSVPT